MDILSCVSSNFLIPCGVCFYSVYKNSLSKNIHFHVIIDESVSKAQTDSFSSFFNGELHCKVSFYVVNVENIKQYLIEVSDRFKIPVYYRLLLSDIIPSHIDKILYIDSDIIVRHDLTELWNVDIDNVAIAAVENQSDGSKFYDRLNYPQNLGYFNSGVLLINVKWWRKNNLTDTFIKYIMRNPERLINPDQDVLNYILKNSKVNLPLRYNVQEAYYHIQMDNKLQNGEVIKARNNPYIVHFTGFKPWEKLCKHPLRHLFFIYKRETPWKNDFNISYSLLEQIKRILHYMNILHNEHIYIDIHLKK